MTRARATTTTRLRGSTAGFTLIEMIVSIGIAALVLGVLASAVSNQGRSAVYQMGAADMQQNVRGALDLFGREVRMAGYGLSAVDPAVLPAVEVLAPGANLALLKVRGNYLNVQGRGCSGGGGACGTAAQIVLSGAPFPAFSVGEQVAIESALLGVAEVRTIGAYNQATGVITVTAPFANSYLAGSPVNQINTYQYRLDTQGVLWRSNDPIADQINLFDLRYVLADGTKVANPAAQIASLRGSTIQMRSAMPPRDGLTPQSQLGSEVRIRNLGIVRDAGAGA